MTPFQLFQYFIAAALGLLVLCLPLTLISAMIYTNRQNKLNEIEILRKLVQEHNDLKKGK